MGINSGKKARRTVVGEYRELGSISPMNEAQKIYLNALKVKDIVFAVGSAGTGKTYIATSYAAEMLYYRRIRKIILTRPNIESGPSMGFLPGSLDDKYLPYLVPYLDTLYDKLGKSFVENELSNKNIEPIPIGFLRGRDFKDCLVILDEAQNTTPGQMKLLLSRIGTNCKMVIDGDTSQCDIKGANGLTDAIKRLQHLDSVSVVSFKDSDIVRSDLCKEIILAYKEK